MTIEHKLQHFEELCIHSAQEAGEKNDRRLYGLSGIGLRDHEENVRKQAEARIQTETETIQREANKRLAINQIGLKRTYSQKQEELQGRIFSELRDRLARFMETPAYETLLKEQIRKARILPRARRSISISILRTRKSRTSYPWKPAATSV